MNNAFEHTTTFNLFKVRERQIHETLSAVHKALKEKGYNPINQIVGYIITEDPTYITNHANARAEIRKIDRDELLRAMVQHYLDAEK